MKINKSKILKALKADLKSSEPLKNDQDALIAKWKAEYNGEPYGNESAGKSAIVSRDIKKQSEWQHASIIEPFVSTSEVIKCTPITFEDEKAARQNEILLNTQFCRKFDRFNFMSKSAKVLDREGTVVIQTGWDYEEKRTESTVDVVVTNEETGEEELSQETVTEITVLKNQPTAKVCRNSDIYLDPTCQDDLDKAEFIIYRYETNLSTLKKDPRYKNLERLTKTSGQDYDYDSEDPTDFEFSDEPRKKMVVYEYWGNYDVDDDGIAEPIVCAWVDDVIIRLSGNPYPDKKPPFLVVPFNSVPFKIHGESNAELIGVNQKIKSAVLRGIIDSMAKSNNGQVATRKGALDPSNRKRFLSGKNFEYNGSTNDFWQGSYNQIPGSVFDVIGIMNNEIESITGTKSFSGGINSGSLGNMLDIETDIPLIDGTWKKLKDIQDGDKLVGSDGRATNVVKAHDIKNPKQAYDMVFDNTTIVKSGGEHLWTIKVQHEDYRLIKDWHTVDADTVYEYLTKGKRVYIPKMKEVHTGKKATSTIDPYVLGFWLGDGNSHSARITTEDFEVLEYFDDAGYECVEVKDSSKTGNANMYDVYKKGHLPKRNSTTGRFTATESLHSELRDLNLHARYGGEKHIPEMFINATYEEKMELIRGLMDSDGFAHTGAFVQFAQSEGRLKDDFIKLLQSLGLKISIRVKDKDKANKDKLKRSESTGCPMIWTRKDAYEIGFTPWSNPFKLTRKASKWQTPRIDKVTITSMEKVDKVPMRCLTVDSKDKLFAVTDRFILTHNTATGARGALDATSTRRMNVVRNIAENLVKPLMRKWTAYNAEFLEDEEVVRVTNEKYVPVRRDDLGGLIDIEITISTAEDNAAKSQELSFLLQTLGPSEDPAIRRSIMADIMELMRMPEQAKRMRDFQPQVDPAEEQMKKMQLENLMLENENLKAQIQDRLARAGENVIDAELKKQKAAVEAAKVRKLTADADMADLAFIKEDEGYSHLEKIELEDLRHAQKLEAEAANHRANIEQMLIQKLAGDNNIGVYDNG